MQTASPEHPSNPEIDQRFALLPAPMTADEYNYEHFRATHLLADARRSLDMAGIQPGELAPDFALPRADGGALRLSDLRDRPVLLHFGSFT